MVSTADGHFLTYFKVNRHRRFYRVVTPRFKIAKYKLTVLTKSGERVTAHSAYDITRFLHGNMLLMFVYEGNLYPLPRGTARFRQSHARNIYSQKMNARAQSLAYDSKEISGALEVLRAKKETLKKLCQMRSELDAEAKSIDDTASTRTAPAEDTGLPTENDTAVLFTRAPRKDGIERLADGKLRRKTYLDHR